MKKTLKQLGVIALVAITGFSIFACTSTPSSGDDIVSGTYSLGNYTHPFWRDAIDYLSWELSSDNIARAKHPGTKFEFVMSNVTDVTTDQVQLWFFWQDLARGLDNQDGGLLCGWRGDNIGCFPGVTWDANSKKISVDLSTYVKDNRFKNARSLKFVVGITWYKGAGEGQNISVLGITNANIVIP